MEEGSETTENQRDFEGDVPTALQPHTETLPSPDFVKVEKNLASLGFFTPSSKRLQNAQEKSFTITTVADGQRMELKGTIIPSAKYGLPITADQDKWIALCKILTDILQREGRVTNPVSFTSAEILRLLHQHRHSGKNYREIEEWLDVLFSTTIFSEGVVYLAGEKRRVKDRYRVFERAVSFGKELSEGKTADKNYVWFSGWQLQNINNNYLLPIDIEAYRELKNHIAKALVPLLQVWLYATREQGVYEKRYDELCEILNIRRYQYLSLIRRTLSPSLDELLQFGYLADWQIQKTADNQSYKILLYHGEKFHRDRSARLSRKRTQGGVEPQPTGPFRVNGKSSTQNERQQTASPVDVRPIFDPQLIAKFTGLGITEQKAHELLANRKPGQDIVAQLEHAEETIKQLQNTPNPVRNPAGFCVRLIEYNTPIPDGFETSAQRRVREEREQSEREDRLAREEKLQLQEEYDNYCDVEIDRYIAENQTAFDAIKDARWKEDKERFSFTTESMAKIGARFEVLKQLPLLTFEEFLHHKKQGTDFSLKPVGVSPAADPISAAAISADPTPSTSPESAAAAPEDLGGSGTDAPATAEGRETAIEPGGNPAMEPGKPEPMMIELGAEPTHEEQGDNLAEPDFV